jgi:hypothetical protein
MAQEIIFTPLPYRRITIEGKQFLQLSVFTTIRLKSETDTTLGSFNDILTWPEKILNTQFRFRFPDREPVKANLLTQKIDPALFNNIFHKDIRVNKNLQQAPLHEKNIKSFPARHINDFLRQHYRQIAVESPKKLIGAEKFIDEKSLGKISQFKLQEKESPQVMALRISPNTSTNNTVQQAIATRKVTLAKSSVDSQIQKTLKEKHFLPFAEMQPETDFAQFRNFHQTGKAPLLKSPPKVSKPEFEFHDILAIINSYPQLMRKLGIVLDFNIPFTSTIPLNGTLQLIPGSLGLSEPATTMTSVYEITETGFYMADEPGDLIFKRGFVKINTGEFSVIQGDTDGVALKTNNLIENKVQSIAKYYQQKSDLEVSPALKMNANLIVEPPEDEGLPSTRSAGIAVCRNGMAEHLFKRFNNSKIIESNFKEATAKPSSGTTENFKFPGKLLYSNDVIQAYRMDIAYKDNPEKWYSLHQRKDDYTWYDETNKPSHIDGIEPDEGYIELVATENPEEPDDLYIPETLARWEGWSLSVRKPGFSINKADDYELKAGEKETAKHDFVHKEKSQEIKKYAFDPIFDPNLHFKINTQSKTIPGTLPKLRFGKAYRIRIRAVDLAGNSVDLKKQSEDPSLTICDNIRYMRHEPLTSPIVLVGNELRDGEFLERLVIRSNFDKTAEEYEKSNPLDGKVFDNFSQRYILPPKNSQSIAETHGKIESAFKGDPAAAKFIYDIITSHEKLFDREGNVEKIYKPSEVEIMYLPDPMAAGVALFVAEGNESTHTQDFFKPRLFSFFTNDEVSPSDTNTEIPIDWYVKARVLRIRLEEGEPNTAWGQEPADPQHPQDPPRAVFKVFLPKGHRSRVKFSTFWREEDLKQLSAVWEMIKDTNPANLSDLEKLATTGQHWMISPSREFELVHAVQQPVDEPAITALIPDRDFDNTNVNINVRFTVHGESTEKVELQARWTEPLDDSISVTIKENPGRSSITGITVSYNDDLVTHGTIPEIPKPEEQTNPKILFQPHLNFQTQNKTVFLQHPQPGAVKVNKLYQDHKVKFDNLQAEKQVTQMNLVNQLKFDIEESRFSFINNIILRFEPLKHNFGDTKHRWVEYCIIASSRYREYFDKLISQASVNSNSFPTTRGGITNWTEKINILSSSRPKLPAIDYIIPTFEWRKSRTGNSVKHKRMGGGLRIFLKRPWYSTGAGEMLGIIMQPPVKVQNPTFSSYQPANYTSLYTHWGLDPFYDSTRPQTLSPKPEAFSRNTESEENLQYPDSENLRANVLGYPVIFDDERQEWYCDLAIDPGNMYFPFVKLALARYQPHSVRKGNKDVCLSPVVFADMIQLMPDRQATITVDNSTANPKIRLSVEGVIYNEINKKSGVQNVLRITILENPLANQLYSENNFKQNSGKPNEVIVEIAVNNLAVNSRFVFSREFALPSDYKKSDIQIIIQEFERGPEKLSVVRKPGRVANDQETVIPSSETDKIIYNDIFKLNELKL